MIALITRAGKLMGDQDVPNFTALANAIGCHRSSLYTWLKIPKKYHAKIVKATNGEITLKQLERAK